MKPEDIAKLERAAELAAELSRSAGRRPNISWPTRSRGGTPMDDAGNAALDAMKTMLTAAEAADIAAADQQQAVLADAARRAREGTL